MVALENCIHGSSRGHLHAFAAGRLVRALQEIHSDSFYCPSILLATQFVLFY